MHPIKSIYPSYWRESDNSSFSTPTNKSKARTADTLGPDAILRPNNESWGASQEKRRLRNTKYRVAFLQKKIFKRTKFSTEYLKSRTYRIPSKASKRRYSGYSPFPGKLHTRSGSNLRYQIGSITTKRSQTSPEQPTHNLHRSLNMDRSKLDQLPNAEPTSNVALADNLMFIKVKPVEICRVSLLSRMIQTRQRSSLERNAERRRLLKAMRRHSVDISGISSEISGLPVNTYFRQSSKINKAFTYIGVNTSNLRQETYYESSINVW
ncbi:hypothetical protein K7432_010454 [Basidiobolus ranarum]|uniref:Ribosomal protein S4 n=1 Tax=Basidiobolus ranarum TaxID=34480 RepID=A0ABR2VVF6_9FUNG